MLLYAAVTIGYPKHRLSLTSIYFRSVGNTCRVPKVAPPLSSELAGLEGCNVRVAITFIQLEYTSNCKKKVMVNTTVE